MLHNASRFSAPPTGHADLPNSRTGCNADDLSSLTSLAPSDKDGNVVLKLALRAEGWLRDAAPPLSGGADANVSPSRGFILRARYGFRVIGNCGLPSSQLSEFLVDIYYVQRTSRRAGC